MFTGSQRAVPVILVKNRQFIPHNMILRLSFRFVSIMVERTAIIDLGTNTFHLLIAETSESHQFRILKREVKPVKIGSGGINEGHLTDEAYKRGLQALRDFNLLIIESGAKLKKIIGTSALRNADNAPNFLFDTEVLLNCPISLIDGNDEAEYIYYGVREALGLWPEPSLILDIGGGSVEFILGNKSQIIQKKSLEIGAARLIDKFPHHFPMKDSEKQNLESYLKEVLQPLFNSFENYQLKALVGASGFFETFANLHRYKISNSTPNEMPLYYTMGKTAFDEISNRVLNSSKDELYKMPGMEAFRVEMMPVSTVLLALILESTGIDTLYYSDYAVKEGVLARELT